MIEEADLFQAVRKVIIEHLEDFEFHELTDDLIETLALDMARTIAGWYRFKMSMIAPLN